MIDLRHLFSASLCTGIWLGACAIPAAAADPAIILQSTTSTANSGLYDHILPSFRARTGIRVNVVAVGTGQALKNARNCDGDVLLVHAKAAEERFVREGYGVARHDVMYNDFVIVGPREDPAEVIGRPPRSALAQIARTESGFVSRGDNSGTHRKELELWRSARLRPEESSGRWYRETGSSMGATLNVAAGMNAYALTDRATWLSFNNKANLAVLVEGDHQLFNQYGVILVNPERCPRVNVVAGQRFIDWLLAPAGQTAIGAYELGGQALFFPNAKVESIGGERAAPTRVGIAAKRGMFPQRSRPRDH